MTMLTKKGSRVIMQGAQGRWSNQDGVELAFGG